MSDDMKVSKGLEFPVVALPGVGRMPAKGEDEKEAARVFYVEAIKHAPNFLITTSGHGTFLERLANYPKTLARTNNFD